MENSDVGEKPTVIGEPEQTKTQDKHETKEKPAEKEEGKE